MEEIEIPEDNLPFRDDDGQIYFKDEKGVLWREVENLPCPKDIKSNYRNRRANPVKTLNLSFTVNIKTSLVSLPYPHLHGIFEAVNSDSSKQESLNATTQEFGKIECERKIYNVQTSDTVELNDKQTTDNPISEQDKADPRYIISEKSFNENCNYFEKHFVAEVKRLLERFYFEGYLTDSRGEDREGKIKFSLEEEEQALRQRLKVDRGRIPIQQSRDFRKEKENFTKNCIVALSQLARQNQRLNKRQLSLSLFPKDTNPLQALRRKLKVLNLTFESIIEIYEKQKLP